MTPLCSSKNSFWCYWERIREWECYGSGWSPTNVRGEWLFGHVTNLENSLGQNFQVHGVKALGELVNVIFKRGKLVLIPILWDFWPSRIWWEHNLGDSEWVTEWHLFDTMQRRPRRGTCFSNLVRQVFSVLKCFYSLIGESNFISVPFCDISTFWVSWYTHVLLSASFPSFDLFHRTVAGLWGDSSLKPWASGWFSCGVLF
jgi:hypothetical protein